MAESGMIDNAGGGVAPGQDVESDALLGQVEGARPMVQGDESRGVEGA